MSALTKRGRGRPKGTTSVWRNAANVAAHHASVLFELWLAGVSVLEAGAFLGLPTGHTRKLLFECWGERGNGPQHHVPLEIKRKLCELAIAHVVGLQRALVAAGPAARRHSLWAAKPFKVPNVKQVLSIVARRAPPGTLRSRKRAAAPDSPEMALRECEEQLQNAWRADPEIPTAKSRKKARDRAQAKARRAARGAKSPAESATRPWEAEGISRRTWERRRKAAAATLTQNVASTQK
jgi:hypothetical protein